MRVCAHIGLHKTGSTWLQDSVFPAILRGTDWRFFEDRAKVSKDKAWRFLEDFDPERDPGRYMISCENLSGSIDISRKAGENWSQYRDCIEFLEHRSYGLGMIVGFRNHKDWLVSAYLQTEANYINVKSLDDYVEEFTDDDLSWSRRVREARDSGLPVFFYFLEEVASDGNKVVDEICQFLGIDPACDGLKLSEDVRNSRKASSISTSVYKGVRVFGRSAPGRALKKSMRRVSGGRIRIEYDRAAEWASARAASIGGRRRATPALHLSKARREFLEWDMAEAMRLVEETRGRQLKFD
ncbi:sulfotransferase domain-containing protein [Aquibaculum sediminis]|uniref:sulfotransferase domain-containing protein n=1 Tax=Aquibaculum sediminis TaxID=3231907 RepID=UPI003452C149